MAYQRAVAELVFAGALWGFGFIATSWALESLHPVHFSTLRFSLGFLLCVPYLIWRSYKNKSRFFDEDAKRALVPGMVLGLMLLFQTAGLKYTTATKCAFITTLYVIIVPLIEAVVFKKKITKVVALAVFVAFVGTALISRPQGESINVGDILTLVCAFFGAAHIILVGHYAHSIHSPFVFNAWQILGALVPSVLASLWHFDVPVIGDLPLRALGGLLYLAFFSSILAFALQVRAQRVLSPTTSSVLFLLESPYAALFAWVFLNEALDMYQWVGALLIMIAASMAVL